MKILITGGAGFIGSNFVHYWIQNHPDDKIINFDKLSYAGHLSSLKDIKDNKNYEFVTGDICDRKAVDTAMIDIDMVVHFAAESHVDRSIVHPENFIHTNVFGTYNLLDSALKNKVKRFHHVSTDEVFGALPLESPEKFNEHTCYNPHSPYSASKAGADHLVSAYHDTYGLNTTITNCSNNFGPYQDPEKLLPRWITNLMDGKNIPVYGDGKYVRDWLYVEDHCRAIELALLKGKPGETYLVGGMTKDISNLEIARKLLETFDLDDSHIEYVKDRPGHDRRYAVDWSKINTELGWKPLYNFETWLEKTVEWYKDNEWWWRPLKEEAEYFYNSS